MRKLFKSPNDSLPTAHTSQGSWDLCLCLRAPFNLSQWQRGEGPERGELASPRPIGLKLTTLPSSSWREMWLLEGGFLSSSRCYRILGESSGTLSPFLGPAKE